MRFFPIFPPQASTMAGRVDALYLFLVGVTVFFGVLIAGLIVYFAWRYRRRHDAEVGRPVRASFVLEVVWTGVPLLLTMVMFFWGANPTCRHWKPPWPA